MRERLPDTRRSLTHRVKIRHNNETIKLYITVGLYEDGRIGEVFLQVDERGTMLSGFCICIGVLMSLCLQNGVTLSKLYEKLSFQDFSPQGFTDNKTIHTAHSIIDYVIRWMKCEFGDK